VSPPPPPLPFFGVAIQLTPPFFLRPRSETVDHWRRSISYTPEGKGKRAAGKATACAPGGCDGGSGCACGGSNTCQESQKAEDVRLTPYLCYGCQVALRDHDQVHLPPYVAEAVSQKTKTERVEGLRDQIKDFLLEEEEE